MALTPQTPIITPVGFEVQGPYPADTRIVKNTLAERDAIPTILRYEGLQVFVIETRLLYLLPGPDLEDWVPLNDAPAVEWGNITGNIQNQSDLWGHLEDIRDDILYIDLRKVNRTGDTMTGDLSIRRDSTAIAATFRLGVEGANQAWGIIDSESGAGGEYFGIGQYTSTTGGLVSVPFVINPNSIQLIGEVNEWTIGGNHIWVEGDPIDAETVQGLTPIEFPVSNPVQAEIDDIYDELDFRYVKTDFINISHGSIDAGKPIILSADGKIHASMLDVSTFYYVGPFTPTPGDYITEYPDTTNEEYGAFWVIQGVDPTNGYTFTSQCISCDLYGKTVNNGDFMVWAALGWSIMAGEMNPTLYYKLDGSNAITGPFNGGNQQFKTAADGTDDSDLVTLRQLTGLGSEKVDRSGDTMTGDLIISGATLSVDGNVTTAGDVIIGDGTTGGNLFMRSRNDDYNPQFIFQRQDGSDVISAYTRQASDYILALYDPDGGSPYSPVIEYAFTRTGATFDGNIVWDAGNAPAADVPIKSGTGGLFLADDGTYKAIATSNVTIIRIDPIQAAAGQTDFVISGAVDNEIVNIMLLTIGGVPQSKDKYEIVDTNVVRDTVRLTTPLEYDTTIVIEYFKNLGLGIPLAGSFIGLTDTPPDYTGHAGKVLAVNAAETAVEFITQEQANLQIVQAPPYDANAGETDFVIPSAATDEIVDTLSVTIGGSFQSRDQYTIVDTHVSRDTIRLNTPLEIDSEVIIEYFKVLPNLPASRSSIPTITRHPVIGATIGQTDFIVNKPIIEVHSVIIGGSAQTLLEDYTIETTNQPGDTIRLVEAIDAPADVLIEYYSNI